MAKDDLKILRNWIDAKSSLNIKHKSKIKIVEDEGDCLRCPNCGNLVFHRTGRCYDCGQVIIP